jgi:hypothetical protein
VALRACKECKVEISGSAKVCPHCGKKQGAGFLGGCLTIILVLFIVSIIGRIVSTGSPDSKATTTSNPAPTSSPVDPKEDTMSKVKLDFRWSKDEVDIMTANFVVKNESNYDIKDFEIKCEHFAKSGTNIDSNTRTIYDVVKAHSTRKFPNFNMGFIHSQAASSACKITDLKIIQ